MTQQTPKLANLFKLEFPQSVGSFATYEDAQKAVDHLADAHFPVENLAIVGTDLRSIERVLGRRTWGTVIGQGMQSGLSTGLLVAFLMWILQPNANFLVLIVSALVIGIVIGIAFAALGYWMSQGKRDFTSVSQTIATRYELLSEHKVAGQARELLAALPGARAALFDPRLGQQQTYPGQQPPYPGPRPQAGYPGAQPQTGYPGAQSPAGGSGGQPPTQPPTGYPSAGYPPAPYPGPYAGAPYPPPGYSTGYGPGPQQQAPQHQPTPQHQSGLGYPPESQTPPAAPSPDEPRQG